MLAAERKVDAPAGRRVSSRRAYVSVVVMAVTGAACGCDSDNSGSETVASSRALPGATITASTAVQTVEPSAAPTTGEFAAPPTSSTRPREIAAPSTGASDATSGCLKELYDTAPGSSAIVEFGDLDLARNVLGLTGDQVPSFVTVRGLFAEPQSGLPIGSVRCWITNMRSSESAMVVDGAPTPLPASDFSRSGNTVVYGSAGDHTLGNDRNMVAVMDSLVAHGAIAGLARFSDIGSNGLLVGVGIGHGDGGEYLVVSWASESFTTEELSAAMNATLAGDHVQALIVDLSRAAVVTEGNAVTTEFPIVGDSDDWRAFVAFVDPLVFPYEELGT